MWYRKHGVCSEILEFHMISSQLFAIHLTANKLTLHKLFYCDLLGWRSGQTTNPEVIEGPKNRFRVEIRRRFCKVTKPRCQRYNIYIQRYTDITDIRWYTDVSPFHTWLQALIRDRQMSLPQIWNLVLSIQDHEEIPSCSNAMNQAIRFTHVAFILRTLAFSEVWAAAPQSEKCPASEATCPTPPWVTMKSVDIRCTMHCKQMRLHQSGHMVKSCKLQ